MGPLANSVFVRLAALLLAAVVLFNVVMGLVLFLPVGRERADLYVMPFPTQAAAIVDVIEASPPEQRPRVLDALNSRSLRVRLLDELPAAQAQRRAEKIESGRPRPIERFFANYDQAFADHEFHIEMRRRRFGERLLGQRRPWEPARLYVRLHEGGYVLIEPARAALLDGLLARGLAVVGLFGVLVLIGLWLAVRQTARPITTLAANARAFADRLDAPNLAETGSRELRDLAQAFNHMKGRIRGLVDERTRLLAAIAHDLRTYLTRLRLRAEFIDNPDQRARAERDIDEMSALIDDTLVFARSSERADSTHARAMLGEEIAVFVAARQELGETVSLIGTPPVGAAAIEPLALRRILANLTDNALRYGGGARISAHEETNGYVLRVEDDGPGVPASELERVTAPFERIEPSRARASGGAGLGLAIVRALAESAGGTLSLANRPEGGLTAMVRLKRAV